MACRSLVSAALVAVLAGGALAAPSTGAPADPGGPDDPSGPPSLTLARESANGVRALDVPLADRLASAPGGRLRTARLDTSGFSMLGLTWRGGTADLRFRVHSGGWGRWREAEPLRDGPDADREREPGLSATEPMWVGAADGVQVEVAGRVRPRQLELALIDPGVSAADNEVPRTLPAPPTARSAGERTRAPAPRLLSRRTWGADPRLRNGRPTYNRTIQQVHVHHTANSNGYRARDVPGLLRGMYRYHTQNLGWSDIGYNFLVDRFGRTWVGRAGGPGRKVRGAHTLGFNNTSTGVAVIGNFQSHRVPRKVTTALVRLAAWKLDKFDRNPRGRVLVYSHGSDLYPAGRRVWLPTIDGHRDTNRTVCPGTRLYRKLPAIRKRAAQRVQRF